MTLSTSPTSYEVPVHELLPATRYHAYSTPTFGRGHLQGSRQAKTSALVDSGADYCVNLAYATLLNIDLETCTKTQMQGVSGVPMDTYTTLVSVQAEGLKAVRVPVVFVDSPGVDALIGQIGFFDQHRVTFERAENAFEIVPVVEVS